MEVRKKTRIAAMADIHIRVSDKGLLKSIFEELNEKPMYWRYAVI
ncbi:hypothetical protein L950_0204590 [Sphingobacterium sp. IITKGP-BTPF85]|nr:hypothetical protein L950_0204590 [Sphingobacterium sp. IITKGP-BTPF85]